jgi:tRNA(Ile)-lysidine synthase
MVRLGPFEHAPRLALAVSGGPDSLALALLAVRWAKGQGGSATGLIVDHGLRPEAAADAVQAAAWLQARGIEAHILPWYGAKPAAGLQAAARAARYALLADWCRAAGVLHLLTAHHLNDQAETVAMRAQRQSGRDGLAGMAPVRELPGLRLLRPLLPVAKARLLATLAAAGQPWLEDPSNQALRFERARLRAAGLDAKHLAALAAQAALERTAEDAALAAWLARWASVHPAGFVTLDRTALAVLDPLPAGRVLSRALLTVGNRLYPPRRTACDQLVAALRMPGTAGRTLAGCRILPWGPRWLICREPAAVEPPVPLQPGIWCRWDRRFAVRVEDGSPSLEVGALGPAPWPRRQPSAGPDEAPPLPAAVRPSLPAVRRAGALLAVPHLRWSFSVAAGLTLQVRHQPSWPLAGPPFLAGAHRAAAAPAAGTVALAG